MPQPSDSVRRSVAALFVVTNGVYFGIEGVDPWDIARDAKLYDGNDPVIAHPPCERWGRYWSGGPNPLAARRTKGDDGGCFASALASVRRCGGVLEHPEASAAWKHFGLIPPPKSGGWFPAGDFRGYTCCVEQGHYGHPARKATWLYAVGVELPSLPWGTSGSRSRLDQGHRSLAAAKAWRAANPPQHRRTGAKENLATPLAFRDVLIGIARSASPCVLEGVRASDHRGEGEA